MQRTGSRRTRRAYVGGCDPLPTAQTEMIVMHPDGRVEAADDALHHPNGVVITHDGGTLIVAESHGQCLAAFTIASEDTLVNKRAWAALPGTARKMVQAHASMGAPNQELFCR